MRTDPQTRKLRGTLKKTKRQNKKTNTANTTNLTNTTNDVLRRTLLTVLGGAYVVLWVGGVAQHLFARVGSTQQSLLAALFLTFAGVLVWLSTHAARERWLLVAVALFGFAAEVCGVHLGVPFGVYSYTDALGPRLLGVPLVMPLAWMTLAAYVKQMLGSLRLTGWLAAPLGALWLTGFDLLLDPLAANQLDYWRWAERGLYYGIPATNFAGWFIVSLIAFSILRPAFASNALARLIGLSLILFFTLLALAHGAHALALVGCGLCVVHLFVQLRQTKA